MSWRSLRSLVEGEPTGADAVERSLLGAIMLSPSVRLSSAVSVLRPADFRSPWHGSVFAAVMLIRDPEAPLVVQSLEEQSVPPPPGFLGWGEAVSLLLDDPLADDEAAIECAKAIRRERIRRQAEARKGANP